MINWCLLGKALQNRQLQWPSRGRLQQTKETCSENDHI